MILYQRSSTPYFLRLLTVIFHPASFVAMLFLGGFLYAAYRVTIEPPEEVGIMIGVYIGLLLIGFFFLRMYLYLHEGIRTKIVLIEIVPGGLRIHQLVYARLVETVISPTELIATTGKVWNRGGSIGDTYRTTIHAYSLTLSSKVEGKPSFHLIGTKQVIGEIVEKLDQEKLVLLSAEDANFLMDFQSERKSLASPGWRWTVWAIRIGVIGGVLYFGYAVKPRVMAMVDAFTYVPHPIQGTWRLVDAGMGNVVTFNRDSSLTESIEYTGARWKYFEKDSITKAPARIIVVAGDPNLSETEREYEIVVLNDSVMHLKRNFDGRTLHMEKNVEYIVSRVGSLIALFEQNFLMRVPQEVQSQVLKNRIPESQSDQLPTLFLTKGMQHVFLMSGYSGWSVAVFNTETEELQRFENFPNGAAGVCSQSLSVVKENERDVIQLETQCEEGDPAKTYFDIDDHGKLVSLESGSKPVGFSSKESFDGFPRKWFPLTEGTNGYERQQLCGRETFIEIFERDGLFIWKEQGFQEVWEAEILDFTVGQGAEDFSTFKLKGPTGEIKDIEILPDPTAPASNNLFDGNRYTSQPELFTVNNSEDDCT